MEESAPHHGDPTSDETVPPSESHEWQDDGGEAGFVLGTPSKKKSRKLELEPPDFAIPEFGGGAHRKRYPLDFKLNAIKYAQSVVKGGRGPGGTVGISYASRALGISDKATLAAWIKNRNTFEKEVLSRGASAGGSSTALPAGGGDSEKGAYERMKGMLDNDDGSMDYIFENNREWVAGTISEDPDTFKRLATSQQPKYLYIGCSDSRVPAQNMMGLTTGELFVVRNVANLCVNTDHSLLAALTYAVNVLEVTDIIVCGHYGCGGVRAAMENVDHGLLEHWLLNIRNVQRLHLDELKTISDVDERHKRLVELNVQESCINLFANPIVQKKQATSSQPKIHGWVYDVATGLLKKLDIDFKSEIKKYQDVYRLYEFPRRNGASNEAMTPRRKVPSTDHK